MNTALWGLQGLLGFAFLAAGMFKLLQPKEKLTANPKLGWANDFSAVQVKLIGLAETLGAVGLIVPRLTGILPVLTPIAAAGLVVIMIGAMATHVRRKESFVPPAIMALLAVLVAIGRFVIVP
jgi:hypothetical protein